MDAIDMGQEREQLDRERAIASARARQHAPSLPYVGQCYHCGDITGGGRRFCDADCRDDYERIKRAEAQRGV